MLILDPKTHLTSPCWLTFGKHVRRHAGWMPKRRRASEEEKKKHHQTKKSASYFVYVRFGKANKNKTVAQAVELDKSDVFDADYKP